MTFSFRLHAVPLFVRPSAQRMRNFVTWEAAGTALDPAWLTLAAPSAGEVRKATLILPHQSKDVDLLAATMSSMVITAEKSRQHNIRDLATNARRLMPSVVTTVLLGESHFTIPTHNPQQLNRELTQFLD